MPYLMYRTGKSAGKKRKERTGEDKANVIALELKKEISDGEVTKKSKTKKSTGKKKD